jgi:hypothetical protein
MQQGEYSKLNVVLHFNASPPELLWLIALLFSCDEINGTAVNPYLVPDVYG